MACFFQSLLFIATDMSLTSKLAYIYEIIVFHVFLMPNDIKAGNNMLIGYSTYVSCNQLNTLTLELFRSFFLVDLDNNTSITHYKIREQDKIMMESIECERNGCRTILSKIYENFGKDYFYQTLYFLLSLENDSLPYK